MPTFGLIVRDSHENDSDSSLSQPVTSGSYPDSASLDLSGLLSSSLLNVSSFLFTFVLFIDLSASMTSENDWSLHATAGIKITCHNR